MGDSFSPPPAFFETTKDKMAGPTHLFCYNEHRLDTAQEEVFYQHALQPLDVPTKFEQLWHTL